MKWTDAVYARSPVLLQHAAVSVFGYKWKKQRFGGRFNDEVRGFLERERFDVAQWRRYQTTQLRALLTTCLSRVPYYQQAWRRVVTLDELERFELEDLRRLPMLEKDAVRADPTAFLLDGKVPANATVCATSGSTGTPVRTYWLDDDFQRSLALREARGCMPAGVSYSLPRATFSGRLVVPASQKKPPFHRFNVFERQVYFSAFHLSPAHVGAYVDALRRHHIVWGTGYTHAWEQLGLMMLEQQIAAPHSLKAIITTSEALSETGRKTIERAFGCQVFQEYGVVEDALWACEGKDRRMRLSPDAGILELIRPNGDPVGPGEAGEVVATGFIRRHQPLIRYRLGDVAKLSTVPDESGRSMPIIESLLGRTEDVVIGPDGQRTVRFHGVFTEVPGVREGQVIQTGERALRLRVAGASNYGAASEAEIRQRIAQRFGPQMQVSIEQVERVPRTRAGKYRAVINLMTNPRALDEEQP